MVLLLVTFTSFVFVLVVEGGTVVGSNASRSTFSIGGSLEEELASFSDMSLYDGSSALAVMASVVLSLSSELLA